MRLFEISSLEKIESTIKTAKEIFKKYGVSYDENTMIATARKNVKQSDNGLMQTLLSSISDRHVSSAVYRVFTNPDYKLRDIHNLESIFALCKVVDKDAHSGAVYGETIESLLIGSQDYTGEVADMIERWFPGEKVQLMGETSEVINVDKFNDLASYKQGIEAAQYGAAEVWQLDPSASPVNVEPGKKLNVLYNDLFTPSGKKQFILAPEKDHRIILDLVGP